MGFPLCPPKRSKQHHEILTTLPCQFGVAHGTEIAVPQRMGLKSTDDKAILPEEKEKASGRALCKGSYHPL